MRLLLYVIPVALAIYAVLDCARTPKEEMPAGLPKPIILLAIILFAYVGPIAWIVISRVMKAESTGEGIKGGLWSSDNPQPLFNRTPKQEEVVDLPPDDDPDFLWKLEAQIQRQKSAEKDNADNDNADKDGNPGDIARDGNSQEDGGTVMDRPADDAPSGNTPSDDGDEGDASADGQGHDNPDDDTPHPEAV